jgi:hypothetical protein
VAVAVGDLTTMVHPETLTCAGISVSRLDQAPGEFVVTFPRCFHGGWNHGFNVNEAANFALPAWLPFGAAAYAAYRSGVPRPSVFDHDRLMCAVALSALFNDDSRDLWGFGSDAGFITNDEVGPSTAPRVPINAGRRRKTEVGDYRDCGDSQNMHGLLRSKLAMSGRWNPADPLGSLARMDTEELAHGITALRALYGELARIRTEVASSRAALVNADQFRNSRGLPSTLRTWRMHDTVDEVAGDPETSGSGDMSSQTGQDYVVAVSRGELVVDEDDRDEPRTCASCRQSCFLAAIVCACAEDEAACARCVARLGAGAFSCTCPAHAERWLLFWRDDEISKLDPAIRRVREKLISHKGGLLSGIEAGCVR